MRRALGFSRAGHRHAQPRDGLAVQLANTRFGNSENISDFTQVQLLFVVQRHHQLFPLRQRFDRHDQGAASPGLFQHGKRIVRGGRRVALEKVAAFIGHVLDIDKLMAARIKQQFLIIRQRHAQSTSQFALGGRSPVFVFKFADCRFDLAHLATHTARQPVQFAQTVQHGAANALAGIGFKLGAETFLVAIDCIEQPYHSVLDQIIDVDAGRQLRHQQVCDAFYQRNVLGNVPIFGKYALGGVHQCCRSGRI